MIIGVLFTAITVLFFAGAWIVLESKQAARLDAKISHWIGYRLFPKSMRKHWGSKEDLAKYLTRKKILLVYKVAGLAAVVVACGLMLFTLNIS